MSFSFAPRSRRRRGESIVPMINVVFLLLVFFLMTSRLAPPDPLAVRPPQAQPGAGDRGGPELLLGANGEIAFGALRGPAAETAFTRAARPGLPARLRADAQAPADQVAALMARLAAAGISELALVVSPR